VEQLLLIESLLNFIWCKAVFIVKVIKCAKIILLDKVFSSIIVTIASAKDYVWICSGWTTTIWRAPHFS